MAIFDVPLPPPITPFEMQGLQDLQQLVALKELEFDSLQKDYDRCEGREQALLIEPSMDSTSGAP